MLFNSFAFLIFFSTVTSLYFLLPHRARWALLLGASIYFYMYFIPVYVLILLFTIVVDYAAGIFIENASGRARKMYLLASLVANIGALAFFKYCNFIIENLSSLASFIGWNYPLETLAIVLPVGLSFHTFQAMSYTFEVYYGRQKAERHFGIYALYVMFYPQLVAGPIERPQNLLHQFRDEHRFDAGRAASGLKLMLWGLLKKSVVADRLALLTNVVFAAPQRHSGPVLALAVFFFAIQIFCDFSGYSDIAIGSARVMGFDLMQNFKRPYHAASIADFWRRWHISLSTWFRDYVYIPLGGSRASPLRRHLNILIVFLLSGLWHGANWTYVVWGGLHGFYLITGTLTSAARERLSRILGLASLPRLHHIVKVGCVFVLVCVGWIFFRAASLSDAWYMLRHLGSGWSILKNAAEAKLALFSAGMTGTQFVIALSAIGAVEAVHLFQARHSVTGYLSARPWWIRWSLYYGAAAAIFWFGIFGKEQFIYFQF